ncbi:hypothetical protein [Occallatibacter riparius]|uniref:Cyclic di-GMP-binding protein n=1 Tax=Occallatibacter riparius TaxID=1002689 RepID=A0A9J7BN35_9BACT|nr:hypothetical protein [Occallatibacter riparius]UWZ82589.1 hypothetical protein MOP44_18700 [Occallatibacter riparius]
MARGCRIFAGVLLVLSAVHQASAQNAQEAPSRAVPSDASTPPDMPVLLSANLNSFSKTLLVSAADEPKQEDFVVGPLASTESPDLQILPSIQVQKALKAGNKWAVTATISGRIPFGTSTVPVYFQGTKINTLRIIKTGLAIDNFPQVQSEDQDLLFVLRNPTSIGYDSVSVRLRFDGTDVCDFSVEQFSKPPTRSGSSDCADVAKWSSFSLPQYAGVSLRTSPPHGWFVDKAAGLARSGKQKGVLTLRYVSGGDKAPQVIDEQNIPVETEFKLGLRSRTVNYLWVAVWLLVGALGSVLLRVAIPNYRRFRSLREELIEVAKVTRGITDEVDSMLRVQLRVERLSLDTLRKAVSVISPGFTSVEQRVSSGITTLKRRIDYVRRLDASLNRLHLLVANELAPPTRIAAIERHLDLASEALQSVQFRDEDWVLIQQTLESADKLLNDPTEEDKSAFQTSLVERWKNISGHFKFVAGAGLTLTLPIDLQPMTSSFPLPESLPKDGDDGRKWIEEIGTVRADLQISALELIREFEFLAPAAFTDHWVRARDRLITWLATPALDNLNEARSLLRQLAEGVDPRALIEALQAGEAQIELDPQSVGSGERVRMSVRFRRPTFNSAAARREILCEWRISAQSGTLQSGTPEKAPVTTSSAGDAGNSLPPASPGSVLDASETSPRSDESRPSYYRERGWDVYHYFESFLRSCPVEVRFYWEGKPVTVNPGSDRPLIYQYEIDLQVENASRRKSARKDSVRRVIFETFELGAVLLVPLCALAISTADQNTTGFWWQLVGLGFGSDTIRSVLSGQTGAAKTSSVV